MLDDDIEDVEGVEQEERDDEQDDERDDGECHACHGSGGGDGYLRCPYCVGRGYVGSSAKRSDDYHDDYDRWSVRW